MRIDMNIKNTICKTIFIAAGLFQVIVSENFPPATETYQRLNQDPKKPFVVSFGTSMSQTHTTNNTCHPTFIRAQLQKLAQLNKDPRAFLANLERIWYLLCSLPYITCDQCKTTFKPDQFELQRDKILISNILTDLAAQKTETTLTITKCPHCLGPITAQANEITSFTEAHQQAMVDQINFLGLKDQIGCQSSFPPYRLSVEASDVMHENSTEFDPEKIAAQAAWLERLGNPFLFSHHYANPETIPNLFEKEEHASWFAKYNAELIKASPNIKYICPISQPSGLSMRIARQNNLPPFTSSLPQSEYFKNIIRAHVAAYDAIKAVNPNTNVFVSNQWKPMVPLHASPDPRYFIELIVSIIANRMYNHTFVSELKKYPDKFDGLALSVYPALYFDRWIPCGNNCSGKIDAKYSLESIMEMHKAFPNKPIFIVETGCNNPDHEMHKKFIDMTLHICAQARELGADVRGVYFWGHTNDPDFYTEWNTPPRDKYFGMFEGLDPQDPNGSINPAGEYLKEIVRQR